MPSVTHPPYSKSVARFVQPFVESQKRQPSWSPCAEAPEVLVSRLINSIMPNQLSRAPAPSSPTTQNPARTALSAQSGSTQRSTCTASPKLPAPTVLRPSVRVNVLGVTSELSMPSRATSSRPQPETDVAPSAGNLRSPSQLSSISDCVNGLSEAK